MLFDAAIDLFLKLSHFMLQSFNFFLHSKLILLLFQKILQFVCYLSDNRVLFDLFLLNLSVNEAHSLQSLAMLKLIEVIDLK